MNKRIRLALISSAPFLLSAISCSSSPRSSPSSQPPPRIHLVNNGNGTVSHSGQGLSLMWQQDDSGGTMSWGAAKTYCETLELGGYSDWRLPTIPELRVLYKTLAVVEGSDPESRRSPPFRWSGNIYWSLNPSPVEEDAAVAGLFVELKNYVDLGGGVGRFAQIGGGYSFRVGSGALKGGAFSPEEGSMWELTWARSATDLAFVRAVRFE